MGNNSLFTRIALYIAKETKANATDKSNYTNFIVSYSDIKEKFSVELEQYINSVIIAALMDRSDIEDVFEETDGFDVTVRLQDKL